MTPEEYILKLKQLRDIVSERAVQEILVPNTNELLANIKNRIVRDKKNSSGSQIGTYSIKPMYATQKQFDKKSAFKPIGKKGPTKSSMYLPGGYSQLRSIQGKQVDGVNVNYTGSTMLSYQMQVKGKDVVLGFTDIESSKIRKGLENGTKGRKGYGNIYNATQQEIANYNKNVAEDSKELTLKILHG